MKDYYYILGVESDTTIDEIKIVHRKLSKKFHPDLNPNDTHSEKMFKDIQEAYECLSNPLKRKKYDFDYDTWLNPGNTSYKDRQNLDTASNLLVIKWIKYFLFLGLLISALYHESESGTWFSLDTVLVGIFLGAALSIYLIPFFVALRRNHSLKWIILGANIFLGGTGIGWFGCLAFAYYTDRE